jgi:hypothetical protein
MHGGRKLKIMTLNVFLDIVRVNGHGVEELAVYPSP